jgi:hypothetical protein
MWYEKPTPQETKKIKQALNPGKAKTSRFGRLIHESGEVLAEGEYPLLNHIYRTKYKGYKCKIVKL